MLKMYLSIISLFCSLSVAAQPITAPTKASQPIPKLTETKNMNVVVSEKIQAAITRVPSLKGQAVSASIQNGTVILQGSVANKNQETDAIEAAKSIAGVKEVKSQLTIKVVD